jgi:hypothetical protein
MWGVEASSVVVDGRCSPRAKGFTRVPRPSLISRIPLKSRIDGLPCYSDRFGDASQGTFGCASGENWKAESRITPVPALLPRSNMHRECDFQSFGGSPISRCTVCVEEMCRRAVSRGTLWTPISKRSSQLQRPVCCCHDMSSPTHEWQLLRITHVSIGTTEKK